MIIICWLWWPRLLKTLSRDNVPTLDSVFSSSHLTNRWGHKLRAIIGPSGRSFYSSLILTQLWPIEVTQCFSHAWGSLGLLNWPLLKISNYNTPNIFSEVKVRRERKTSTKKIFSRNCQHKMLKSETVPSLYFLIVSHLVTECNLTQVRSLSTLTAK